MCSFLSKLFSNKSSNFNVITKPTVITKDLIQRVCDSNSFPWNPAIPSVVVFRNTNKNTLSVIEDNRENLCDTICIVDSDSIQLFQGRTIPHKKYQDEQSLRFQLESQGKLEEASKLQQCNHTASGFYPRAWQKGMHFKYRALTELQPFVIWRSIDGVIDNGDDFLQQGVIYNNVHGFSPWSAGCITVTGNMTSDTSVASDDWKIVDDWIFNKHHAYNGPWQGIVLRNSDIDAHQALRVGSQGDRVKKLQEFLKISADGDFGIGTMMSLRNYQKSIGIVDTGVAEGIVRF